MSESARLMCITPWPQISPLSFSAPESVVFLAVFDESRSLAALFDNFACFADVPLEALACRFPAEKKYENTRFNILA